MQFMSLDDIVKSRVVLPKGVEPKEVPKIIDYIVKNCRLDINYGEITTSHSSIQHKERPRAMKNFQLQFEVIGSTPDGEIKFECASHFPDIKRIYDKPAAH